MVNLAKSYPEQKTIKSVSEEEKISVKYLERLVNELRKIDLVTSQKGKSGGYVLSRKPSEIKVGEIIENLEGTIAPMKCVENGKRVQCQCASKVVWDKLGEQIRKTLYGIRLSDLIKR
jgi:Rrf2 family protein